MITNPNPIEQPAVQAKVFNKLHVYTISAIQPSANSGSIAVELIPATSDGELSLGNTVQRFFCELHPTLEQVPELATAFDAIMAAIPATLAWQAQQKEATNEI